jgi:predicted tellurium resistance membrane protein TerC
MIELLTDPYAWAALVTPTVLGIDNWGAPVADGLDFHTPRGYIYSAIAFVAAVEVFNVLAVRNRRRRPRTLK